MNLQTFHLPFDVPLLPAKMLTTGNLKCMYEKGNLRYISIGETEVVRMIYSAVRDENWETATYEIHDEVVEEHEDGFAIAYTATYQLNQIRYTANVTIEGKGNAVSFAMKGVALSSFRANRVGICVLHPIQECAGKKVLIEQKNGQTYEGIFPESISPDRPFKNVQQMHWEPGEGLEAVLTFSGDIFETEDQRNWTDASYKTYSRPLDLPFPFTVVEGESMEQRITLTVLVNKVTTETPTSNLSSDTEIKIPFPRIGYGRRQKFRHLSETEIKCLQQIPFDHYRVELQMDETGWQHELEIALSEARELNTKLELIVFFEGKIDNELQALIEKLRSHQQYVSSLLVLHKKHNVTPEGLLKYVYHPLKDALSAVKIGYGTDGYFADLNANMPNFLTFDFVGFSITPQVHAFDTRSILETLQVQADTIKKVRAVVGDKPVHVSPVTLRKRGNPNAGVSDVDARQHTWFTAYWTLQTIKNLGAAESLTFYETVGPKGILQEDTFTYTDTKEAEERLITPVHKVLAAIKAFKPRFIILNNNNNNKQLLLEDKEGQRMLFITDNFQ